MNIEHEPEQELTIGQMLYQARTARGLTLAQVASQLNLSVPVIEQLEQDKFKAQIQETYVKGYIRAYAKLLKIPEIKLKDAFMRDGDAHGQVIKPMQTFSNRTKHQATDNKFIWLTYGIIVFFIALLIVWWWQTETSFSDWGSANISSEQVGSTDLIAENKNTVAEPPIVLDNAKVNNTEAADAELKLNDNADANLLAANPDATSEAMIQPSMKLAERAEESPEQQLVQDSLNMQFTDACWVNVIDAEGERIAFGTKEKGYVMTLKGKAPFVVTLGNPEAVVINFNNQPYDVSTLPKGRVAKFTIPGSE
ncbi:RodZ domain-containing protein [Rheinheimera sp. WS51]|uniref:RodZ domain-containing protein n=1 Tax=Rheinheimera sp. WS51 TaxID=3425886 RepID=UPI003D8DBEEF